MSDDPLQDALNRAFQAKTLLENELFREAFQTLETAYATAWKESQPHEFKSRENYWCAIQILGDVQKHLQTILTDGVIARAELDELAKRQRPKAA
jgi:hypothetical protein